MLTADTVQYNKDASIIFIVPELTFNPAKGGGYGLPAFFKHWILLCEHCK